MAADIILGVAAAALGQDATGEQAGRALLVAACAAAVSVGVSRWRNLAVAFGPTRKWGDARAEWCGRYLQSFDGAGETRFAILTISRSGGIFGRAFDVRGTLFGPNGAISYFQSTMQDLSGRTELDFVWLGDVVDAHDHLEADVELRGYTRIRMHGAKTGNIWRGSGFVVEMGAAATKRAFKIARLDPKTVAALSNGAPKADARLRAILEIMPIDDLVAFDTSTQEQR